MFMVKGGSPPAVMMAIRLSPSLRFFFPSLSLPLRPKTSVDDETVENVSDERLRRKSHPAPVSLWPPHPLD
jgi:hypothetical protein